MITVWSKLNRLQDGLSLSPSQTYIAQTDECHWVYSSDIKNIGIHRCPCVPSAKMYRAAQSDGTDRLRER